MHYEPTSHPPTFRRRRAPIACRLCRKRKIKCITHENPPQGRCERCERKDLKCEYVTVADEEAQVVSSSQSSSPELSRSYHKLQNEAPYYPNPTNVDPQWSRKFPEAYCSDDLTSYLANPQNISSHYTGPLQPQQSRPQPSYTGLSPDPYASPYHLVAGGFGQDYNGHRGLTTTTSPDPWSPSSSHSSAHAHRDNSAYLFGSHHQNASLSACKTCGAPSPSQCRCHSRYASAH